MLLQMPCGFAVAGRNSNALESGAISAGHGKALLAIANPEKQLEAAKRAANGTLTVRAIEKMAVSPDVEPPADPADQKIDSYFKEMELSLQERMGRRVSVQYGKKKVLWCWSSTIRMTLQHWHED